MSGGDDWVITLSHSVIDDGGNVTGSHMLEAHHDGTDGIDLTADDDHVQTCEHSWYDAADRVEALANHGSGSQTAYTAPGEGGRARR